MGNFFGQPEETNEYPDSLDQVGILKIIELLGTVSGHSLENNPAPITDSRFNSDCALASHLHEITVKDPEILNFTLELIADCLIEKLSSDERVVEVFPKDFLTLQFLVLELLTLEFGCINCWPRFINAFDIN